MKSQLIADFLTIAFKQKTKHQLSLARRFWQKWQTICTPGTSTDNWETVKELQLTDPDFNKPTQVDHIIGNGHYEDLMVGNNRLKEPNIPIPYRLSVIGWLEIGCKKGQTYNSSSLQAYFVSSFADSLQRFWEIEEVPATKHLTEEERTCEEQFKSTIRRNPDGRFIVQLPFKKKNGELGIHSSKHDEDLEVCSINFKISLICRDDTTSSSRSSIN